MRSSTLLLAAIVVATPGCAVKALYKAISKSKYERVTGPKQQPVELTRGVRTPKGVYVIEVRYSNGSLMKVRFDPAKGGPRRAWPRAVPEDPIKQPLPVLSWTGKLPVEGSTPLTLKPCAGKPGAKPFPCAQLKGNELWICQGPGKPIPVARFRVWTKTHRRKRELTGTEIARKVALGFLFPLAIAADAAIVAGYASVIWLGAGAPGLGCF